MPILCVGVLALLSPDRAKSSRGLLSRVVRSPPPEISFRRVDLPLESRLLCRHCNLPIRGWRGPMGLEPATSCVTVVPVMMQAMRRSEAKLHRWNAMRPFQPLASWKQDWRIEGTCTG